MLNEIFYFILNMSITAATIVIILLFIRVLVGKYISKTLIYLLWCIVLFRLLIPISISSRYSFINLIDPKLTKVVEVDLLENETPDIYYSAINSIQLAENYNPIVYKSDRIEKVINIASSVWLIVTCIFLITLITIYIITMKDLNRAVKLNYDMNILYKYKKQLKIKRKVEVYESVHVNTPIVIGVSGTRIIVPHGINSDMLDYVLLHELSHIKRKDNIWRLLSILAVCIHWFNPFAWLFLYFSGQDMESACDLKVLRNIPYDRRKDYALSLVKLADDQRTLFPAMGNTIVKQRLMNIINYRKLSTIMIILTSVLCMIITILLITNPIV
ncbi:peptidase M56 [Vallitalea longa]|uniref:Peptidase M56 n=1 Tax=Vallitalea longa TaxID=2936439 RepID=A0A9W6DFP2_9FIRM|nr:M56 family metallopeptidase [Vallitalea longa]GKX30795.1 peptidase M56 [Vallitalea longa]